ncbi:MAG: HPr family phosphocarrier protein [Candidatus Omnitrophica bacterium]|nr:HPr family phosphocarrier protein [Candidatus Omnitrophota bacterium]MDE2222559.1 HPr family phosphocarrier protein [Candidatus Omnitrophota bacterium]
MIYMEKIEKELTVINKKGLHARPAAVFVSLADKFGVAVTVSKGAETVNGKSIMNLLMLGAVEGTVLKLSLEGDKAFEAMREFEEFFKKQDEDLPT